MVGAPDTRILDEGLYDNRGRYAGRYIPGGLKHEAKLKAWQILGCETTFCCERLPWCGGVSLVTASLLCGQM